MWLTTDMSGSKKTLPSITSLRGEASTSQPSSGSRPSNLIKPPNKPGKPTSRYNLPNVTERKRFISALDEDDEDDPYSPYKCMKMKDPPEDALSRDMFKLPPHIVRRLNPLEGKFYDKGRRFLTNLQQKAKPPRQVKC